MSDQMSFDALREFEPFDWPDRYIVEQDNMGDWGGWLSNFEGALDDALLDSGDCRALAESMAEEYIGECESAGFPMPADFDESGDNNAALAADLAAVTSEFVTYLQAWRAAIAKATGDARSEPRPEPAATPTTSCAFPVFPALPSLGFVPREAGKLRFTHPQFELDAFYVTLALRPAVYFVGQLNVDRGRVFGVLDFTISQEVESLDQLKAFLAYYLSEVSAREPTWITEGRALSHLLPWERQWAANAAATAARRKAYAARDYCIVRREWLKLALKDLAESLKDFSPADVVVFAFDGSILRIDSSRPIIVQAEGRAWQQDYRVQAEHLTQLPKRLMHPVEVAIWGGHLSIGKESYPTMPASPIIPSSDATA